MENDFTYHQLGIEEHKASSTCAKLESLRKSVWGDLIRLFISVSIAVFTSYYLSIDNVQNANEKIDCLTNSINNLNDQIRSSIDLYISLSDRSIKDLMKFEQLSDFTNLQLGSINKTFDDMYVNLENLNNSLSDQLMNFKFLYNETTSLLSTIRSENQELIKTFKDNWNNINQDQLSLREQVGIDNKSLNSLINQNLQLTNSKLSSCSIGLTVLRLEGSACDPGMTGTPFVTRGVSQKSTPPIWSADYMNGKSVAPIGRYCSYLTLSCN
jgi:uncharacterized protein YlbG (UPF0298 family)